MKREYKPGRQLMTRICRRCWKHYTATRIDSRYCGDACRQYASRSARALRKEQGKDTTPTPPNAS